MGIKFRFKNAGEFERTLREYSGYQKKDIADILNTKGYYISRAACGITYRTPKGQIEKELAAAIMKVREKNAATGRMRNVRRAVQLNSGSGVRSHGVPLAALIINARRKEKGEKELSGPEMERAIYRMVSARNSSRAFLAACWLPAIQKLDPYAQKSGAPRLDKVPKQIGANKGYAKPAKSGWFAKCIIANLAAAKRDHKEALIKYGGPALQQAFDQEVASMRQYIEKKQLAAAKKAGIRTR